MPSNKVIKQTNMTTVSSSKQTKVAPKQTNGTTSSKQTNVVASSKQKNIIDLENLPSEQFMEKYLEKSFAFPQKLDKKHIQKEFINKCRFKTYICNDASYLTIIEAEKSIDRKQAIAELNKYLKEYYLALEMEKGLFEFSIIHLTNNKQPHNLISNIYYHHLTTLCRNLDVNDTGVENKTLLPMIKDTGFNPFFVAFLKPEQLHPERWKTVLDKKKIEEETENNLQTTDIYTCKKCKDKRFKITEIQIRSIDESSNKICQCMTCQYTFII